MSSLYSPTYERVRARYSRFAMMVELRAIRSEGRKATQDMRYLMFGHRWSDEQRKRYFGWQ